MSRNNKISGYNNGSIDNHSNNVNNSTIDNSITKNNNKFIGKGKNKKKKDKSNRKDLMTGSRKTNNQNPSLNRQNIEKLYNNGGTDEMIAYVQRKRTTGGYVLYNICTHTDFMSDHVIVFPEPEDLLDDYIGDCITFKASGYQYPKYPNSDKKYSIKIADVERLNISEPFNFYFSLDKRTDFNILNLMYKDNADDEIHTLVKLLSLMIEVYSAHMFGSRKFILGMIFNMFYLGSSNHELSDSYNYNLSLSKRTLVYVFSDIIYTLEKYRQDTSKLLVNIDDDAFIDIKNSFDILQYRLIEICMFMQNPDFDKGSNEGYGDEFNSFCDSNEIKREQAEYFIRDNNKRFKFKKIKKSINYDNMMYDLIYAADVVIPVICSIKKQIANKK